MRYQIIGIDSTTNRGVSIAIDAEDTARAAQLAMDQGILVNKIEPIYESTGGGVNFDPYQSRAPVARVTYTYLIDIFRALGWFVLLMSILVSVIVAVHIKDPMPLLFGLQGILSGLLLMAIARVLDYLEYSAQRLRDITELLKHRPEK